jgi:hypothetical protein
MGRVPAIEHAPEDGMRVGATAVGPECLLVVHPRVHDHPHVGAESEEQPEAPAAEPGAEPVLARVAEGAPCRYSSRAGSLGISSKARVAIAASALALALVGSCPGCLSRSRSTATISLSI